MKKINNWVIRTFGLRGSWSWAKKQMLNGAIIKRKATTGTYKIAIDDDKNRLLVATWWEDICDPISRSIMKLNFKKEINNQIWYEQKQGND